MSRKSISKKNNGVPMSPDGSNDIVGPDGSLRGWLLKRGRALVGGSTFHNFTWKRRWIVQQGHRLFYLKKEDAPKPKGFIDLLDVSGVESTTDPSSGFKLVTKDRVFLLRAATDADRDRWVEILKDKCPKLVSAPAVVDANQQLQAVVEGTKNVFSIPSSAIKILHQLGQGSFGKVFLGIWEGAFYAIKVLDSSLDPNRIDNFVREAQLSFSITPHQCVTRVFGMCIEVSKYALVMEFCPKGSLERFLSNSVASNQRQPLMNEYSLYKLALGIASGMSHLASQGIVHRDLAARNILLGLGMFPKISDFGLSRKADSMEQSPMGSSSSSSTKVGPLAWSSPEAINGSFTEASDVWSYGCVLVEMVTGRPPYCSKQFQSILELAALIRDKGINPMDDLDWLAANYGVQTPKWLRELAKLCFQPNATRRPTFKDICSLLESFQKEFFKKYHNEIDDAELARQNLNAANLAGAPADFVRARSASTRMETEAESVDLKSLVILNELGSGNYGKVLLGQLGNGQFVAVKQWTRNNSQEGSLHREFEMMTALPNQKNLVRMYGLITEGDTMSIVMEFVACGTLSNFVERYRRQFGNLSSVVLWKLSVGIARGMRELARAGIVHRDLSARNILLDSETEPKISDFGLSRALKDHQQEAQTQSDVGPIRWMSPEQFNRIYSEKSDVWSYACTIVEMITGTVPFPQMPLLDVLVAVRDLRLTPISNILTRIPSWISPLLVKCFAYEAQSRPTFADICNELDNRKPPEVIALEQVIEERQRRREQLVSLIDSVLV